MTDQTKTPASDAANPSTNQPAEPVATEETTPMTESKDRASETRAQPKAPKPEATPAVTESADAMVSRARDAERDRVSTIYDLAGRLNLERGFAEDLVKRGCQR